MLVVSNDARLDLDRILPGHLLVVENPVRQTTVVDRLMLALSPWSRLRGLLGRGPLEPGQGMLLRPCRQVHTFFMGHTIDVLFLRADGEVLALEAGLRPWRMTPHVGRARCVLELADGGAAAADTRVGDTLIFRRIGQTFDRDDSSL